MIKAAHGYITSAHPETATNPTKTPLVQAAQSYLLTCEYVLITNGFRYATIIPEAAGAINVFIITLAGPFFLGANIQVFDGLPYML